MSPPFFFCFFGSSTVLQGPHDGHTLSVDQQDSVGGEIIAISDISSATQENRIPPRAVRSYHIDYSAKVGFAFINAVILAKFMWLGEILHAGKKAAGKALLHSTLWNAALFAVILTVCHLLEEALLKVWHGSSFAASFSEALADPRDIFATMLLMFLVLVPFFFAKGLIEILGKDEIKRMLLKARTEA